jgi:hypothetical protein
VCVREVPECTALDRCNLYRVDQPEDCASTSRLAETHPDPCLCIVEAKAEMLKVMSLVDEGF